MHEALQKMLISHHSLKASLEASFLPPSSSSGTYSGSSKQLAAPGYPAFSYQTRKMAVLSISLGRGKHTYILTPKLQKSNPQSIPKGGFQTPYAPQNTLPLSIDISSRRYSPLNPPMPILLRHPPRRMLSQLSPSPLQNCCDRVGMEENADIREILIRVDDIAKIYHRFVSSSAT